MTSDQSRIAHGRALQDEERRLQLNALAGRLGPELASLLSRIAVVAQEAVEDSLRRDGTLSKAKTLGQRIAHQVGPVLEHGPQGGWCPRCGDSAPLGKYGVCGSCAATEGWTETAQ